VPDEIKVRLRVDFSGACSVGIGKIELLESIATSGSLSQAARAMGMSYRRAWLLLADLNESFEQPVATTMTGGSGGGGARLTPLGKRLIAGYRRLESDLMPLANRCLEDVGKKALPRRSTQRLAARSKGTGKKRKAVPA
jgi:molybdate transport system regulatory protein